MVTNKIVSVIISITSFIVLPVQLITTFLLGLLVNLTFGLLLIPFSIVWVILFYGPLLGLSYVYEKIAILRPLIAIIGIPLAVTGNIYVCLLPSMGELDSRYTKLIYCQAFPYTWRFYQFSTKNLKIGQKDILHKIFQSISIDPTLHQFLNNIKAMNYTNNFDK